MLNYPLSVFVDTNVFIACKYNLSESSQLKLMARYVAGGKLKIYISNIVNREIKAHIIADTQTAINQFKYARREALKSISSNLVEGTSMEHFFDLPASEEVIDAAVSKFDSFLIAINAIVLDNSSVDIDEILDDYFDNNPPFEKTEKKKSEFPDAIIISKLKREFSEDNPIIIVTGDKGFQSAFQGLRGFACIDSLGELFNHINMQDKIYDEIVRHFSVPTAIKEITEAIQFEIKDYDIEVNGMDYDRKGYCGGFEYTESYTEDVTNVTFELMSINEINEEYILVSVLCKAEIKVVCTYEDYDNSVWDPEEKEYYFLDDVQVEEIHEAEFECMLKLAIINEQDEIDFELSEISFELELDQDTRIFRTSYESENVRSDAEAEMMDALEEYHKH